MSLVKMRAEVHPAQVVVRINPLTGLGTGTGTQIARGDITPYGGPYTVIPTEETQTLPTRGKDMQYDVTVAPIPTNYGKITRIGSVIMIT